MLKNWYAQPSVSGASQSLCGLGVSQQRDELVERRRARRERKKRVARVEQSWSIGGEFIAAEPQVAPVVVAQDRHDLAEVLEAARLPTIRQRFGKEADRLGDPDRQESVEVRERRLSQQAGDGAGVEISPRERRWSMISTRSRRVALSRRVVGEGLLVLDRPVGVDAKASLRLRAEVVFEQPLARG